MSIFFRPILHSIARLLRLRPQLLRLNLDIAATLEFVTAALVVSFDHAPRLFIDHLLAKSIASFAINLMEACFFDWLEAGYIATGQVTSDSLRYPFQ